MEAIESNRTLWRQRAPSAIGSLHTLGVATYLDTDTERGVEQYRRDAQQLNPILRRDFGSMYNTLHSVIESVTGIPAGAATHDALPGFHIFEPFTYNANEVKWPHYDLHVLRRLTRSTRTNVQSANCLTMTAILEAPPSGASIDFWDVVYDDERRYHQGTVGRVNQLCRDKLWGLRYRLAKRWTHSYTIGSILVVRGLPDHRISPLPVGAAPGRRISLQGHGTLTEDGWELFW